MDRRRPRFILGSRIYIYIYIYIYMPDYVHQDRRRRRSSRRSAAPRLAQGPGPRSGRRDAGHGLVMAWSRRYVTQVTAWSRRYVTQVTAWSRRYIIIICVTEGHGGLYRRRKRGGTVAQTLRTRRPQELLPYIALLYSTNLQNNKV